MFWKFGFHQPSAIDSILTRESFTLTEILDEEDVLQECRNQNKGLNEYLSKDEVVRELLNLISTVPEGAPDDRMRFKYANVASEVLTSDTQTIIESICQGESLDLLWGILDAPAPLNPIVASYFTKVIYMLLNKRTELITQYIYNSQGIFNKMISHLGTSAIMDVLRRMTGVESGDDGVALMQWLAGEKQLVAILVGMFDTAESGTDAILLTNISTLIQDLISDGRKEAIELQEFSSPSPFLNQLQSEDHLSVLLKNVLESGDKLALELGLPILLALLDDPVRGEDEAPLSEMDIKRHEDEIEIIMKSLLPRLGAIQKLLVGDSEARNLGRTRLNAARVLEAMVLATGQKQGPDGASVDNQLIEIGTIPVLLDLFEKFTENNFLHKHVTSIVEQILSNPKQEDNSSAPLFCHLFENDFLARIIRMFETSDAREAQCKAKRCGYMGHLTKIANSVVDCGAVDQLYPESETDEAKVALRSKWLEFKKTSLDVINKRNLQQLGGKPPTLAESSGEEEDDDEVLYASNEDPAGAGLAFQHFLHQRIAVDFPSNEFTFDDDDDDVDEDDDDGEDGEPDGTLAGDYGTTEYFGDAKPPAAATSSVTEEGTEWQIHEPAEDGTTPASTGSNWADFDAQPDANANAPVAPLDLGTESTPGAAEEGVESVAEVAGDPVESSTPIDAPATGWANFDAPPGEAGAEQTEPAADGADAGTTPAVVKPSPGPESTVDISGGGGIFSSSA